jgi:hypothetical protein
MGMDVYGKAPSADAGEYFRNTVWWWHPLWTYVEEVAPELVAGVSGHHNNGEGLNTAAALALADTLTDEIASGRTERYVGTRSRYLDSLPDEACRFCPGTGMRHDGLTIGRNNTDFACNACGGTGTVRPWDTEYAFSVDNVIAFRDFVVASGGFEIW